MRYDTTAYMDVNDIYNGNLNSTISESEIHIEIGQLKP